MFVEGEFFKDLDLIVIGGKLSAFTIEVAKVVDDGFVSIKGIKKVNHPKISAIEIILQEVHTAHAVAQGPYVVVDQDDDGFGVVSVDASKSPSVLCKLSLVHILTYILISSFSRSKPHTRHWNGPN